MGSVPSSNCAIAGAILKNDERLGHDTINGGQINETNGARLAGLIWGNGYGSRWLPRPEGSKGTKKGLFDAFRRGMVNQVMRV